MAPESTPNSPTPRPLYRRSQNEWRALLAKTYSTAQGGDLFGPQASDGIRRLPPDSKGSNGRTLELIHLQPDRLHHSSNLVLSPLAHDHYQPGLGGCTPFDPDPQRFRQAVVQSDPPAESLQLPIGGRSTHLDPVGLFNFVSRVCNPGRQFTVIGKQDEPRTIDVQPPDREQRLAERRDYVSDAVTAARVFHGRYTADRLVIGKVFQAAIQGKEPAANLDMIPPRVRLDSRLSHHGSVYRHVASGNELLGFSPRAHARPRYDELQPQRRRGISRHVSRFVIRICWSGPLPDPGSTTLRR